MTAIATDPIVWGVLLLTYIGMASGRTPGLAIDRTGIALAGVIVLLLCGALDLPHLQDSLELPTLLLLFALMLVAAHFELAHGFDWIADHLNRLSVPPSALLALTIVVGGVLSAVLVNDIVAFAFTPMLCAGLRRRGYDPRPFLLALAAAVNAGSAATLIGNPQNILIGQVGRLHFVRYMWIAGVPALVTLAITYCVISVMWRRTLATTAGVEVTAPSYRFNVWLGWKSLLAAIALIVLLSILRERVVVALVVAAVLMLGRRLSTRDLLGRVDGPLLVLIACLFIVTATASRLPGAQHLIDWLRLHDLLPYRLGTLTGFALVAGNTIGNVPAVVLLLQGVTAIPQNVLYALALLSTLSGNLLLTGSLANIIVAERSARHGVRLGFMDFARAGIPITLLSIAFACGWMYALGIVRP